MFTSLWSLVAVVVEEEVLVVVPVDFVHHLIKLVVVEV
tara:strand:- start:706 stop:819 length:114 start_codon:yes stop_codon:yes gene_type:complete